MDSRAQNLQECRKCGAKYEGDGHVCTPYFLRVRNAQRERDALLKRVRSLEEKLEEKRVRQLEARVAELEGELADCRGVLGRKTEDLGTATIALSGAMLDLERYKKLLSMSGDVLLHLRVLADSSIIEFTDELRSVIGPK